MTGKPTEVSNFTLYPLAWLTIAFAAGIFLDNQFDLSLAFSLGACLCAAVFSFVFSRKKSGVVLLLFSFVALGALCFQIEKQSVAPNRLKVLYDKEVFVSGTPLEITGNLRGKPETAPGGFFSKSTPKALFTKTKIKRLREK